jgi:hypothetical protein
VRQNSGILADVALQGEEEDDDDADEAAEA